MDLQERLNKISNKGNELKKQQIAEVKSREEKIIDFQNKILTLSTRIASLIEIGNALVTNNLQCGSFRANGLSHKLGLYCKGKNVVGLGIVGGGYCGEDFAVNAQGAFIEHPSKLLDYVGKCEQFLEEFDDFEKKLFEYVDNL